MQKIKEMLKKGNKTFYISLIAVVIVLLLLIGSTFAYFDNTIDDYTTRGIDIYSGTTDLLTFSYDQDISFTVNPKDFGQNTGNMSGYSNATATLRPNNGTGVAEGHYYLYLNIDTNEISYSNANTNHEPELLLQVFDDNNELISLSGLGNQKNVGGLTGYDITGWQGLLKIIDNRLISASNNIPKVEKWKIVVTHINHNFDQKENLGKIVTGKVIMRQLPITDLRDFLVNTADDITLENGKIYYHNHTHVHSECSDLDGCNPSSFQETGKIVAINDEVLSNAVNKNTLAYTYQLEANEVILIVHDQNGNDIHNSCSVTYNNTTYTYDSSKGGYALPYEYSTRNLTVNCGSYGTYSRNVSTYSLSGYPSYIRNNTLTMGPYVFNITDENGNDIHNSCSVRFGNTTYTYNSTQGGYVLPATTYGNLNVNCGTYGSYYYSSFPTYSTEGITSISNNTIVMRPMLLYLNATDVDGNDIHDDCSVRYNNTTYTYDSSQGAFIVGYYNSNAYLTVDCGIYGYYTNSSFTTSNKSSYTVTISQYVFDITDEDGNDIHDDCSVSYNNNTYEYNSAHGGYAIPYPAYYYGLDVDCGDYGSYYYDVYANNLSSYPKFNGNTLIIQSYGFNITDGGGNNIDDYCSVSYNDDTVDYDGNRGGFYVGYRNCARLEIDCGDYGTYNRECVTSDDFESQDKFDGNTLVLEASPEFYLQINDPFGNRIEDGSCYIYYGDQNNNYYPGDEDYATLWIDSDYPYLDVYCDDWYYSYNSNYESSDEFIPINGETYMINLPGYKVKLYDKHTNERLESEDSCTLYGPGSCWYDYDDNDGFVCSNNTNPIYIDVDCNGYYGTSRYVAFSKGAIYNVYLIPEASEEQPEEPEYPDGYRDLDLDGDSPSYHDIYEFCDVTFNGTPINYNSSTGYWRLPADSCGNLEITCYGYDDYSDDCFDTDSISDGDYVYYAYRDASEEIWAGSASEEAELIVITGGTSDITLHVNITSTSNSCISTISNNEYSSKNFDITINGIATINVNCGDSYKEVTQIINANDYQGGDTIYITVPIKPDYTIVYDDANDNSYRYAGANPNNYLCFGTDKKRCDDSHLYRIIGLIPVRVVTDDSTNPVTTEQRYLYKVIKNSYLTDSETSILSAGSLSSSNTSSYVPTSNYLTESIDSFYWNGISSSSSNTWSSSTLNTTGLNTDFLSSLGPKWIKKVSNVMWKVGGLTQENLCQSTMSSVLYNEITNPVATYSTDNKTELANKIGLFYATDYGYASLPTGWITSICSTKSNVFNNNWLNYGLNEWTITRFIDADANKGVFIRPEGHYGYGNAASAVRPTFYLNSGIIIDISAHAGTKADPYRII